MIVVPRHSAIGSFTAKPQLLLFGWVATVLAIAIPTPAQADTPAPTISASMRDTLDLWDASTGGIRTGTVALNKLQLSGTVSGDQIGLQGWSVHGQIFRTDGSSLSDRVGDIQTVDSIDAKPVTRLFESWIEKKFGNDDRSFAIRTGLMDFNADFDSVQTASLFVNSSQGIGADIARSGRNGPSIYPVSAAGVRLSWLPSKKWTFRVAAFDGVPGDPARPKSFVSVRLAGNDGALLIGQVDYHLSDKAKIETGAWRYTEAVPVIDPASGRQRHDQGSYASIEGPLTGKVSAWLRLGIASGDVQTVNSYLGAGIVDQGLIKGRPDDRLGIAIARASLSRSGQNALRLPRAETSIEASYQIKIHNSFAAQPDIQYVVDPAGVAGARNALVFGLRLVVTAGYPKKAPAAEAADPTVPPDGPQPPDQGSTPQ